MKPLLSIKTILIIFLIIYPFSGIISLPSESQRDNPLLKMIGKSFSECHEAYMLLSDSLFTGDSLQRAEMVKLYKEAAAADKSGEWELHYRMVDYHVRFYESRDGSLIPSEEYTAEEFANDFLTLVDDAEKGGFRFLRLQALYEAAQIYKIFIRNYERAFAYFLEVVSEIDTISTKDFPLRPYIYREMAEFYYMFGEYDDAIVYYRKVTDDPYIMENPYKQHYSAMNGIGLCYRSAHKDYERSDSCFLQILEWTSSNEKDAAMWEGIAEGNIGYNYYLRGEFDTALRWLISAVNKISRTNDFRYVSIRATNIADIYVKKNDPVSAKRYIDIALDYHDRSGVPQKSSHLYDVLSHYYNLVGDKSKVAAYLDSVMMATQRENEAFSGLVLRRVEQQLRAADLKIHEQELYEEKISSQFYMRVASVVTVAMLIISVLLGMIIIFYRRNRKAYRKLVIRSKEWAGMNKNTNRTDENTKTKHHLKDEQSPNESEYELIEKINQYILDEKIYLNESITLDILAKNIGINRVVLSRTINRVSGKNFSNYLNDYRVKEAIRLLSSKDFKKLSIDQVAYDCGFNDRKSFYRVFKNITGISPSDFRRNNMAEEG